MTEAATVSGTGVRRFARSLGFAAFLAAGSFSGFCTFVIATSRPGYPVPPVECADGCPCAAFGRSADGRAAMAEYKEQHFVPQFYLRNFSDGGKVVRTYNIARRLHVPAASIRGQCHGSYLYGSDHELDRALGELEDAVAPVIRSIVRDGRIPEGSADRLALTTFAIAQWGRTPTAARLHELWLTKMIQSVARSVPTRREEVRANLDQRRMAQPEGIAHTTVVAVGALPIVLDLRVKVIRNESQAEFVTSDAPVAFHNQWTQGVRGIGTLGYACAGLQIFLPLDPAHLLCLYDPSIYRIGSERAFFVPTDEARFVRQINALQAVHAEENLYYRAERTADLVTTLPWHLRSAPDDAVESGRYAEEGGSSVLVTTFRQATAVNLRSPVIEIKQGARGVPPGERVQRWRPTALAVAKAMRGEEGDTDSGAERRRPDARSGVPYRRIDE